MYVKLFITSVFFLISCTCSSQGRDSIICSNENAQLNTDVTPFIKGKKGVKEIKWKFFYKRFELKLSDPSFEIVRFTITWDDRRKDMIVERVNYSSIVTTDLENSNISDKKNYSLKNIAPGSLITFDDILIKKDGVCYHIPPFIVYTIL